MIVPIAPALNCLAYYVRGRAKDFGMPQLVARLCWGVAQAVSAWAAGFEPLAAVGMGCAVFLGNFIPHGYYVGLGRHVGNSKGDWLRLGNGSFWCCFLALVIIGALRGGITGLPAGCSWLWLAHAAIYPLAFVLSLERDRQNTPLAERLYGFMDGAVLLMAAP